jgi:sigma-E factor negative regulatory protein RseA
MNDTHKEQISSLLDDELSSLEASELIEALACNEGLNKQLDRYALIRDALNEDVVVHQESFLNKVQDALAVEPTVFAPKRTVKQNNSYVAVALAASVAIFSVVIFDVGSYLNTPAPLQSVSSLEAQVDEMLAFEEQQNADMLVNELIPKARLVTFDK